jgi:hypothetical protein
MKRCLPCGGETHTNVTTAGSLPSNTEGLEDMPKNKYGHQEFKINGSPLDSGQNAELTVELLPPHGVRTHTLIDLGINCDPTDRDEHTNYITLDRESAKELQIALEIYLETEDDASA